VSSSLPPTTNTDDLERIILGTIALLRIILEQDEAAGGRTEGLQFSRLGTDQIEHNFSAARGFDSKQAGVSTHSPTIDDYLAFIALRISALLATPRPSRRATYQSDATPAGSWMNSGTVQFYCSDDGTVQVRKNGITVVTYSKSLWEDAGTRVTMTRFYIRQATASLRASLERARADGDTGVLLQYADAAAVAPHAGVDKLLARVIKDSSGHEAERRVMAHWLGPFLCADQEARDAAADSELTRALDRGGLLYVTDAFADWFDDVTTMIEMTMTFEQLQLQRQDLLHGVYDCLMHSHLVNTWHDEVAAHIPWAELRHAILAHLLQKAVWAQITPFRRYVLEDKYREEVLATARGTGVSRASASFLYSSMYSQQFRARLQAFTYEQQAAAAIRRASIIPAAAAAVAAGSRPGTGGGSGTGIARPDVSTGAGGGAAAVAHDPEVDDAALNMSNMSLDESGTAAAAGAAAPAARQVGAKCVRAVAAPPDEADALNASDLSLLGDEKLLRPDISTG
jgi:hypothetical protein